MINLHLNLFSLFSFFFLFFIIIIVIIIIHHHHHHHHHHHVVLQQSSRTCRVLLSAASWCQLTGAGAAERTGRGERGGTT